MKFPFASNSRDREKSDLSRRPGHGSREQSGTTRENEAGSPHTDEKANGFHLFHTQISLKGPGARLKTEQSGLPAAPAAGSPKRTPTWRLESLSASPSERSRKSGASQLVLSPTASLQAMRHALPHQLIGRVYGCSVLYLREMRNVRISELFAVKLNNIHP